MTKELVITESLTSKICQELMNGVPLARLARAKDMPGLTRIYKEIGKDKNFLAGNLSGLKNPTFYAGEKPNE